MERPSSGLRILAPVALVAFAIVFLLVVASSGGGGGGDSGDRALEQPAQRQPADGETVATETDATTEATKDSYTVKSGDTLDEIAAKTGVSVEEIEELNPTQDPQALIEGTRLKLRE